MLSNQADTEAFYLGTWMPARVVRPLEDGRLLVEIIGRTSRYRIPLPWNQVRSAGHGGEAPSRDAAATGRRTETPVGRQRSGPTYRLLRIEEIRGRMRITRLGEYSSVAEAIRVAETQPRQPAAPWAHQQNSSVWSRTDRHGFGFLVERADPDNT